MNAGSAQSSSTRWAFKAAHSLERRRAMAAKLVDTHPDRVPMIVQPAAGSGLVLTREKFLTPAATRMARFLVEVRRSLQGGEAAHEHTALFLLVGDNQVLVPSGATAAEVRARHSDSEDGMVYVQVAVESTFG